MTFSRKLMQEYKTEHDACETPLCAPQWPICSEKLEVFTNVSRPSKPVNPGSFNRLDLKRIRQGPRLRSCVVGEGVPTFFMLSVVINPFSLFIFFIDFSLFNLSNLTVQKSSFLNNCKYFQGSKVQCLECFYAFSHHFQGSRVFILTPSGLRSIEIKCEYQFF